MNGEEIIDCFRTLAMSQGSYGRILQSIEENYGSYEAAYEDLEDSFGDCKDAVDLIMRVEGGC